jgi:hypothetical protein
MLADYCADVRLNLALDGCTLAADVIVDSTRWILDGEARLALWNYTDGDFEGRLMGRAGILLSPDWALFGHATYYPGEEIAYPAICAGPVWDFGLLAAGYDFKAENLRLTGQLELAPQVYLAADAFTDNSFDMLSEISVHYQVRDFYEIQLVSNFDGEVFAAVAANF